MIRIERLTEGIDDEVDRLAKGPSAADILRLEAVLTRQYEATRANVHVITGSLKSSARVASNATEDKWEGVISYGGPSTGVHNPVDYAEFELERGGRHDFLEPARVMSQQYIDAINEFLRG